MRPRRIVGLLVAAALHAGTGFAQAAPRRLVLVPEAAVTTEDGPAAVSAVADIAVGRDGSVYVLERQARSVLVLFADGRPPRTVGRAGDGPGEFPQPPEKAAWRGDTVVVADPHGRRLVGFRADGSHAFTRGYEAIEGFLPWMLLADGRTIGERQSFSEDVAMGRRTTLDLDAAASTAGPARAFARLPLRHSIARVTIGSGRGQNRAFFEQPYADGDLFDGDPLGRWVVSVSRPAAAPGARRAAFVLAWRGSDGRVLRATTVPYAPARIAAAKVRETRAFYTDLLAGMYPTHPRGRLAEKVREAIFIPESYPAVTALMAGNDGSTWIRRGGPGEAATWMVFDARGRQAAYVTAPPGVVLHAATATHAWGTTLSPDDVPIVTRFRLRPAELR